jgi:hypothetical protein
LSCSRRSHVGSSGPHSSLILTFPAQRLGSSAFPAGRQRSAGSRQSISRLTLSETATRLLLTHHARALGTKHIGAITTDDVEAAVRYLWQRSPEQGRRTVAAISAVYDYAMAIGRCSNNPAMACYAPSVPKAAQWSAALHRDGLCTGAGVCSEPAH